MIRRIVKIDSEKCTGCGACATACHEGAIAMVQGKARLMREDYCDGLGDCLPACPAGAISFEERKAPEYDEKAVAASRREKAGRADSGTGSGVTEGSSSAGGSPESQLRQWPVQIKLLPIKAPFYDGADLLIAADCTAYAYGNFHEDFIKGHTVLVGCPKLDSIDYSQKLSEILRNNDVRSITLTRMQVPCCGGLEYAVSRALDAAGKDIPLNVVTISSDGRILN